MARLRFKRIDLKRASLRKLEELLADAAVRVNAAQRRLEALEAQSAEPETELAQVEALLAQTELELAELRRLRRPRAGIWGSWFRLKEIPPVTVARIDTLNVNRKALRDRASALEVQSRSLADADDRLDRALSWLEKVESALQLKRRQRDRQLELRAAAAGNNRTSRRVASNVKKVLDQQNFCPYCSGALGGNPHADHIYPISKGGRSVPSNMVYVCAECNCKKRDLTLSAFITHFSLDRAMIEKNLRMLGKDF